MGLQSLAVSDLLTLPVATAALVVLTSLILYVFSKPAFPANAPKLTEDALPLIGSRKFFTKRWDFYKSSIARSATGNFTFYAGKWPVVGLAGHKSRKLFFESRQLGFQEGYSALLSGAPEVKESNFAAKHSENADFSDYLTRRLVALLKGPQLKRGLPQLLRDARTNLDAIVDSGSTDPFDSIYKMIFHFTMRTVACNEIADDAVTLAKCLHYFEAIEGAVTPVNVMYPWVPTPGKAMSTYRGGKLYMIIKNIVDDRNKTGRREEDALQFLMDQGDSLLDMITFVLGSLFAGQLNSGINAAYILCYLATNDLWMGRVREEVNNVADKYNSDSSMPLKERLMSVPLEAWDFEFPVIDLCLREVIRLQLSGTAFRKNMGPDIPLNEDGTEIIPRDTFVTYSMADVHYDEEIYSNVRTWDPARYLPDRAEDKKHIYGFVGWGAARHPCPGMRFAKLENSVIVAFFLAYFDDIKLTDAKGNATTVPDCNINNHSSKKPERQILLKYKVR